jgi:prephenate dehydrogenase/chorismate mutase
MNIDLNTLRKQLDSVDEKIVKLLEERFMITDRVALYKDAHKIPLTDKGREDEVMEKIRDTVSHGILKEHISDIYEMIFSLNKTARRLRQQKGQPFDKVGIIGLGLMGGSIIKAVRMKQPELEIYTVIRDSDDLALAQRQGYITKQLEDVESLAQKCDLIIIASPIANVISIAKVIAKTNPSNSLTVMDIASVKEKIAKEFETISSENITFVATHPMAGSEKMGFANAEALLFVDKPWVICPHKKNKPHQIDTIKMFIEFLGSKAQVVTPAQHDKDVAAVSHIVFLLSCYLFAYISEKHHDALKLAGSGFTSLTRLASGSPAMHAQIIIENYENSMISLMEMIEFMKKDSLTPDTLLSFFKRTKKSRDAFLTTYDQA